MTPLAPSPSNLAPAASSACVTAAPICCRLCITGGVAVGDGATGWLIAAGAGALAAAIAGRAVTAGTVVAGDDTCGIESVEDRALTVAAARIRGAGGSAVSVEVRPWVRPAPELPAVEVSLPARLAPEAEDSVPRGEVDGPASAAAVAQPSWRANPAITVANAAAGPIPGWFR